MWLREILNDVLSHAGGISYSLFYVPISVVDGSDEHTPLFCFRSANYFRTEQDCVPFGDMTDKTKARIFLRLEFDPVCQDKQ